MTNPLTPEQGDKIKKAFSKTGKIPETAFIVHDDYEIQQVNKGFVITITEDDKCTMDVIDMSNEEALNHILKMAKRIERARSEVTP